MLRNLKSILLNFFRVQTRGNKIIQILCGSSPLFFKTYLPICSCFFSINDDTKTSNMSKLIPTMNSCTICFRQFVKRRFLSTDTPFTDGRIALFTYDNSNSIVTIINHYSKQQHSLIRIEISK